MMKEMKERIEKYVDAMVKAEEAKFQRIMIGIVFIVLCIAALSTYAIVTSKHPGLTTVGLIVVYTITGLILNVKLQKKEAKARMIQEELHPTEGEEGALNVARKALNDSVNIFGKKFLGLRRRDEIATDIEKDYDSSDTFSN